MYVHGVCKHFNEYAHPLCTLRVSFYVRKAKLGCNHNEMHLHMQVEPCLYELPFIERQEICFVC
jgi:hypothetical protein